MSDSYPTQGVSVIGATLAEDPYLAYQPTFAYTLPIQLFVCGITITLLAVLLMHLLFTTQYHYPLAPLNYSLQLSSVIVVTLSVIVKTWYILNHSGTNADNWPYDLDYVAVTIPPASWTVAQDAAWFLLQALNNGLSNITHIQFLTLLYPSRTEARLIIFILGPLAIASSGLVFTALSGSQKVLDVSDSIRNVLNSTLLLIFTLALVIWGFFVNRRRAWRTDGGTAVFGFGALLLAVVSTSVNFVAVAEDGIDWLQHLLFAAVLWQTWLGWWWWVGSGMGIGEVEDLMERAERKKRKLARRAARQRGASAANGDRGSLRHRASSLAGIVDAGHAGATAMAGFTSSVAGILRNRSNTLVRRNTAKSDPRDRDEEQGAIEMDRIRAPPQTPASQSQSTQHHQPPANSARVEFSTPPDSRNGAAPQSTNSETSSTSATPSLHAPQSVGQFLSFPTTWLQIYFRRLRRAHEDAAKQAALLRVERRQAVFDNRHRPTGAVEEEIPGPSAAERAEAALVEGDGTGWGLGSFGIKEHRESAKRLAAAREMLQEERLLGPEPTRSPPVPSAGPSRLRETNNETPIASGAPGGSQALETPPQKDDDDWEDMEGTGTSSSSGDRRASAKKKNRKNKGKTRRKDISDTSEGDENDEAGGGGGGRGGPSGGQRRGKGGGWSWWGPLKDWRLNDRSVF